MTDKASGSGDEQAALPASLLLRRREPPTVRQTAAERFEAARSSAALTSSPAAAAQGREMPASSSSGREAVQQGGHPREAAPAREVAVTAARTIGTVAAAVSTSSLSVPPSPSPLMSATGSAAVQQVNATAAVQGASVGLHGQAPQQARRDDDEAEAAAVAEAQAEAEATRALLEGLAQQAVGPNFVRVHPKQRGNPMLKHVRNVPWQYCEQVPDYLLGKTACALFLSLRYHNLHPEYVHGRLRELGRLYRLRILLVKVDVTAGERETLLRELAKLCVTHDLTLVLAWNDREAARYIETFKALEHKPADSLREKTPQDFLSRMVAALTSIRLLNKSDTVTLLSTFGSLRGVAGASADELRLCPGFGENKVQRLLAAFDEPFMEVGRNRPSRFRLNNATDGPGAGPASAAAAPPAEASALTRHSQATGNAKAVAAAPASVGRQEGEPLAKKVATTERGAAHEARGDAGDDREEENFAREAEAAAAAAEAAEAFASVTHSEQARVAEGEHLLAMADEDENEYEYAYDDEDPS